MYYDLVPFISESKRDHLFDILEESSCKVCGELFKEYGWDDETQRLKEGRFIGVGNYRLLLQITSKHLDNSPKRLVEFYEGCKRPSDDPHYEDLIATIIISIVTSVIGNAIWAKIIKKKWDVTDLLIICRHKFSGVLSYLLKGKRFRELIWRNQISQEMHMTIICILKKKDINEREISADEQKLVDEAFANENSNNVYRKNAKIDHIVRDIDRIIVNLIDLEVEAKKLKKLMEEKDLHD